MTAAVKLYSAKTDGEGRTFKPILGNYDEIVTPTEALTAVTEVLRAFAAWANGIWIMVKAATWKNIIMKNLMN